MKTLSNLLLATQQMIRTSVSVLNERVAPWLKWKAGIDAPVLRAIVVKVNKRFKRD